MKTDWDRKEIVIRTKLKEVLEAYKLHGDLVGLPKEMHEGIYIYQEDAIEAITEEAYIIFEKELRHDRNTS